MRSTGQAKDKGLSDRPVRVTWARQALQAWSGQERTRWRSPSLRRAHKSVRAPLQAEAKSRHEREAKGARALLPACRSARQAKDKALSDRPVRVTWAQQVLQAWSGQAADTMAEFVASTCAQKCARSFASRSEVTTRTRSERSAGTPARISERWTSKVQSTQRSRSFGRLTRFPCVLFALVFMMSYSLG